LWGKSANAQNIKKIHHKTNQSRFEPTAVFEFIFVFIDIIYKNDAKGYG